MMADLVSGVAAALAAQGLDVDVQDGADVPAQELFAADINNLPKPRAVFIENGLDGNLRDAYRGDAGGVVAPGVSPSRTFRGVMTRSQACEVRVWGFDLTRDGSGNLAATPAMHRAAVNRLLNDPNAGTGVLAALYNVLGMSNVVWEPLDGYFDNKQQAQLSFGALYVFHFNLMITVVAQRVAVATPAPVVTPLRS